MPNTSNNSIRSEVGKKFLRRFVWVIPLLLVILWLIGHLYSLEISQQQGLLESLEQQFSLSRLEVVRQRMNTVYRDLLFLGRICNHQYNDGVMTSAEQEELKKIFFSFMKNNPLYDQIRVLNASGQELVRLNAGPENPIVVPQSELQNKANRYYFKDTIKLESNEVYMSPLDLNIEKGVLEMPYKPMLRIATPIFTQDHQKAGIFVLNYLANDLFSLLESSSTVADVMLLNSDGYWLKNTNHNLEWGSQIPERKENNFFKIYPEEAAIIYAQEQGQIESPRGLFTFVTIDPLQTKLSAQGSTFYRWKLVSMIPSLILEGRRASIRNRFKIMAGIIVVLFSLGATLFIMEYERRKKILADLKDKTRELEKVNLTLNAMVKKTEYDAMIDPLTELWNRRYMIKRLDEEDTRIEHTQGSACIAIIDLGNFKKINDTYGHARGDKALVEIASILRKGLRQTDYVARSGGDEFLIYFADLPLKKAEKIMERVYKRITQRHIAGADFAIYPDYGVAHCPSNAPTLTETVKVADKRMYEFKAHRKKSMADTER